MSTFDSHDAYIAAAPEPFRDTLARLRAQLSRALPDAREVIKYDMPGFEIADTIVAGYAAFSKQCGLYVDPGAIADMPTRSPRKSSRPPRPALRSRNRARSATTSSKSWH